MAAYNDDANDVTVPHSAEARSIPTALGAFNNMQPENRFTVIEKDVCRYACRLFQATCSAESVNIYFN